MKRIVIIFMFSVSFFLLLSVGASAEEDYIGEFRELVDREELADADFLSGILSPEQVADDISDRIAVALRDMAPRLLCLIGVSVLSAVGSMYQGRQSEHVARGVAIVTTLVAYAGIIETLAQISESMERIGGFFSSMIPLISAVTLSGGGTYTAAGQSVGMAFTVSLFSSVITPLFVTMLAVMMALGLLVSFGASGAGRLMQSIKRHLLSLISIVCALLIGTISLQTILTSARDSAAMRMAKQLAQSTIPVVGSAVSSSLSALWGGLSLTKGVIGVGGICVIIGMFLGPLITLLVYRFAVGLISSAEDFLSVSSPISGVSECLDMLIGVYSVLSVIYVFEIVLFIKGGVSLS